ncbi:MAG: redoxin domain-containing protein, partial [Steroidobacteraceae bacterium]
MAIVALGKKLPDFSSPSTAGTDWHPKDTAGSNLVIYFYPRDNTPGCTREGEDFRDLAPAFR